MGRILKHHPKSPLLTSLQCIANVATTKARAVRPSIPNSRGYLFVSTKRHFAPLFVLALLGLGACTPTIDIHGEIPAPELLAQVKIGQSTEEQVQQLLGSPSSTTTWGNQVWHYIYERTETLSFFTPRVKDYREVTIVFDDSGKVSDIKQLGKKALKKVVMVPRETPTAGKELTAIEQLLGNVGKFSKDKDSQAP